MKWEKHSGQRKPGGMLVDDSSGKPSLNLPGELSVSSPVLGFAIAPEEIIMKYSDD